MHKAKYQKPVDWATCGSLPCPKQWLALGRLISYFREAKRRLDKMPSQAEGFADRIDASQWKAELQ